MECNLNNIYMIASQKGRVSKENFVTIVQRDQLPSSNETILQQDHRPTQP